MFIRRFLWWCAGSDGRLLLDCPNSDQIKHAGFGTLVLIPAALAFFSMTYAVSTLTTDQQKARVIAIIWAVIVFAIDRFIVSNFRKSETSAKDLLSLTFLGRLSLAALVGVIVAHPLVMFIFSESIVSRLDERQQTEIQTINQSFDNQIAPKADQKHKLSEAIIALHTETDTRITQNQQALIPTIGLGRRGYQWRISEMRRTKDRLLGERNTKIAKYDSEQKLIDVNIAELERERTKRLAEHKQARDYVGREIALSDLVNSNEIVRWTQRFLIILFVLVDILPITFKGLTKKESYDFMLERTHKRVEDEVKQEDAVRSSLLTATKEYQDERIHEILKAHRHNPNAAAILRNDIDDVLNRSLINRVASESLRASGEERQQSSKTQPVIAKKSWYGQVKTKATEKTLDLVISVACIPLEALVAFLWFVFTGKDVLRYVSMSTLLQVFPLFFMNVAVGGLFKRTTNLGD